MNLKLDVCTMFYYFQYMGYSIKKNRGICNQAIWNASNYRIYAQFLVRQTIHSVREVFELVYGFAQ